MRRSNHSSRALFVLLLVTGLAAPGMGIGQDSPDGEVSWPRQVESDDAKITVYQPQPDRLDGDTLSARMVAVVEIDGEDPAYGTIWIEASVTADRTPRVVQLQGAKVTRARFPEVDGTQENSLRGLLTESMADWSTRMSLDALTATLEEAEVARREARNLSQEPPIILYRDQPALLVSLQGEPELRKATNASVISVVNTPFFAVVDDRLGNFYLFEGRYWLEAEDPKGSWKVPEFPPSEVVNITPDLEAKRRLESGDKGYGYAPPEIIVATEPTELIVTEGPPKGGDIEGTDLKAVTNTRSQLFYDPGSKSYYVVLSGRWFATDLLDGEWSPVAAGDLPAAFTEIPSDSQYADVKVHVAGTPEATEAVLDAHVPQTSTVPRDRRFAVTYEGPARFEPITGTNMQYAANTDKSVISAAGRYYCADNGVWYVAGQPEGPWSVATEVAAEIYSMPATSPVYNTAYLDIYEATEDEVTFGFYPGYTGTYVTDAGTIVYGTGWTYAPWSGHRFLSRPVTWGHHFRYTPRFGWGLGFSYDPGYFHSAIGFDSWDPCCVWGPGRWNSPRGPYDPRGPFDPRGRYDSRGRWDPRGVADPRGARDPRGVADPRGALDPRGPMGAASLGANTLFADHDGNVMRRGSNGWEGRSPSGWAGASAPHMDGQFNARARGMGRAGGMGGGMRGGGRRR